MLGEQPAGFPSAKNIHEVAPDVARVRLQQGDGDHRPPAASMLGRGSGLGFSGQNGPFRCLTRLVFASRGV